MRVVPTGPPFVLQPLRGVSLTSFRQSSIWDAEIEQLFSLFDLRGDGVIQADEFCRAQLLVAHALGETINEDAATGELSTVVRPTSGHEKQAKPLTRSRTIHALQRAGFHDVDVDGDGLINKEEFKKWQLMLIDSSASSSATKRRHLKILIHELEAQRMAGDSWVAAEAAVRAAAGYHELQTAVAQAQRLGLTLPPEELSRLQDLRQEVRTAHLAQVTKAATSAAALSAALEVAAPHFEEGELHVHEAHLEELRRPFELTVTTLSGLTCTVQASREQQVATLCEEVAQQLGKKAYRVRLAHAGGALSPPSASLEECGVGPEAQLAAVLGEVDVASELSLEEFLGALVHHGLAAEGQAQALRQQHATGELKEEELRGRFQESLRPLLVAAQRRQEEEEQKRRLEEQRKRALRTQWLARARETLADLPMSELEAKAGLGPGESDKASLLGRLALTTAVATAEEEMQGLRARRQELEGPGMQQLEDEAKPYQAQVQDRLDQVKPALEEAQAALERLRKADLAEMYSLYRPPQVVLKVVEAVCRLFQVRPEIRRDDALERREDWWVPGRRLLNTATFYSAIMNFDKEELPGARVMVRIKAFVDDPDCCPEHVRKFSQACFTLTLWVRSMYAYHLAGRDVDPHKAMLARIESKRSELRAQVATVEQDVRDREEAIVLFQQKLNSQSGFR